MDRKDFNEPLMTEDEMHKKIEECKAGKEQPTITEVIEEIKRVLKGSGFKIEKTEINFDSRFKEINLKMTRFEDF